MENTTVTNSATDKQRSEQMKAQLASYLKDQPEDMRSFHRVMKVLESISFGIILLVFIVALVLSFMWKTIPVAAIPTAWMLLPVSGAILAVLTGVHALVLGAFPPTATLSIAQRGSPVQKLGKARGFVTGKAAKLQACGIILVGLIAGAFFAVFAWSTWTANWAVLTPMITILGTVMGVAIAASIVVGMLTNIYQKIIKSR